MSNLTHRQRFVRTLTGQEVDRVPFIKLFGGTNAHLREWTVLAEKCHPSCSAGT